MSGILEAKDTDSEDILPLTSTEGFLNINSKLVSAVVNATKLGNYFSFLVQYPANQDDHTLYFRNTSSTLKFNGVTIEVNAKLSSLFTLNKVTGLGGGTVINPVNWNFSFPDTAPAVIFQDASDVGIVTPMRCVRVPAGNSDNINLFAALELGDGKAISIQIDTGQDVCVTLTGFFE